MSAPTLERMLRARLLIAALAGSLITLAGCAGATIGATDLYRIGCPAVDTVAGGGSLVNKATVAGLKQLRDSGQLGTEAQQWADAAITALESGNPQDLPAQVRTTVVDGCSRNGYDLRNLG